MRITSSTARHWMTWTHSRRRSRDPHRRAVQEAWQRTPTPVRSRPDFDIFCRVRIRRADRDGHVLRFLCILPVIRAFEVGGVLPIDDFEWPGPSHPRAVRDADSEVRFKIGARDLDRTVRGVRLM